MDDFTTFTFPDVTLMSPAALPGIFTLEQMLPRLPVLHHHRNIHFLALGVKEGPGEEGQGEERGDAGEEGAVEGVAGKRNYGSLTPGVYTRTSLSTSPSQADTDWPAVHRTSSASCCTS